MKKSGFIGAALIGITGIVLLFVLIPKIWGILLILLALTIAWTVYNQLRHPEKGDVTDTLWRLQDRFHRARK